MWLGLGIAGLVQVGLEPGVVQGIAFPGYMVGQLEPEIEFGFPGYMVGQPEPEIRVAFPGYMVGQLEPEIGLCSLVTWWDSLSMISSWCPLVAPLPLPPHPPHPCPCPHFTVEVKSYPEFSSGSNCFTFLIIVYSN